MMTAPRPHDDRKGHHYYTTSTARISCIVVMTLAVIMFRKKRGCIATVRGKITLFSNVVFSQSASAKKCLCLRLPNKTLPVVS